MKKKILSLLVLLMTAATGAWAQQKYNVTFSGFDNTDYNTTFTDVTLPYSKSFGKTDACSNAYDIDGSSDNVQLVGTSFGGDNFTITVKSAFEGTVTVSVGGYDEMFDPYSRNITVACVPAAPPFDYTFSAAKSEHGTGKVQFFIGGEEVKGAYQADEGKTVTMTVTPDAGWILNTVEANATSDWGSANARMRGAAPNIDVLGNIALTPVDGAQVPTWTFEMPPSSVEVSATYKKVSTLYFDPADKLSLVTVEKDGTAVTPTDGKLTDVLEGSAIKMTAATGYKFRKVEVKKGEPVKPAATVTTPPTATPNNSPSANLPLVQGGEADGGTLMYRVTLTNDKPTSTASFIGFEPSPNIQASTTYYVWYYVKGDNTHSDSEILGPVIVSIP